MKTIVNEVEELRKEMMEVAKKEGRKPFENFGIIIVPNQPLRYSDGDVMEAHHGKSMGELIRETFTKFAERIKDQLGISVSVDDALVQVRVFDADHREKDTSLQDHFKEWGVQTDWKDEYPNMVKYLPLSLLKKYKQGDVIKLKTTSGTELNMTCLVKYLSVGKTWEKTLEAIA